MEELEESKDSGSCGSLGSRRVISEMDDKPSKFVDDAQ